MSVNTSMIGSGDRSKYLQIPKDRILVESDGPYTKINGRKYTPDLLQQAYRRIANFYVVRIFFSEWERVGFSDEDALFTEKFRVFVR